MKKGSVFVIDVLFLSVLQETLQGFFARQALQVVHKAALKLSGQAGGLAHSQIIEV